MRDQSILIRRVVGFDGFLGDHMPFRGGGVRDLKISLPIREDH